MPASSKRPIGALSSGPFAGGSGPTGILSGGGMNQAMLQLILSGMTRGSGLMPGMNRRPSGSPNGVFTQPQVEMQPPPFGVMAPQAPQGPPGDADQIRKLLEMLKAKGLLGDAEGPINPSMPGLPPPTGPTPFIPPAGYS